MSRSRLKSLRVLVVVAAVRVADSAFCFCSSAAVSAGEWSRLMVSRSSVDASTTPCPCLSSCARVEPLVAVVESGVSSQWYSRNASRSVVEALSGTSEYASSVNVCGSPRESSGGLIRMFGRIMASVRVFWIWLVLAYRGFVGGFGFSRVGLFFFFVWIRLQVRRDSYFKDWSTASD